MSTFPSQTPNGFFVPLEGCCTSDIGWPTLLSHSLALVHLIVNFTQLLMTMEFRLRLKEIAAQYFMPLIYVTGPLCGALSI